MTIAGIALGLAVGLSLGLLGGGGSILTVPIFVYVVGFGAKEAIAMSLAAVGVVSVAGAVAHWRAGNVNWRVAALFGAVAMAGTYLGARLSVFFSGAAQLLLFAVVMMVAAFFMIRPSRALPSPTESQSGHLPIGWIVLEGLAVGVLSGLVGVGGGFLIVPALVLLGRVPMRKAVGTSLVVIALNSAAGFYGYLGQVSIDWAFIAAFSAVSIVGITVGAHLVRYVPQHALRRAFGVFLLLVGSSILYANRNVLIPSHARTPVEPPAGVEAVAESGAGGGSTPAVPTGPGRSLER
jgi:uncharacterized protein